MKFGIVVFPGSNCDEDAFHAAKDVFGQDAEYLWHKDTALKGADVVILPGGFAHGDYLRTGAMARFSPIMAPVRVFAERGGPVDDAPFISAVEDFYFTNPIARASPVLAECSVIAEGGAEMRAAE